MDVRFFLFMFGKLVIHNWYHTAKMISKIEILSIISGIFDKCKVNNSAHVLKTKEVEKKV